MKGQNNIYSNPDETYKIIKIAKKKGENMDGCNRGNREAVYLH
jgi:hypothetical protein